MISFLNKCPLLSQVVPRPEIGCKGPSQDAVLCGQAEVSGNIYEKQEKMSSMGEEKQLRAIVTDLGQEKTRIVQQNKEGRHACFSCSFSACVSAWNPHLLCVDCSLSAAPWEISRYASGATLGILSLYGAHSDRQQDMTSRDTKVNRIM